MMVIIQFKILVLNPKAWVLNCMNSKGTVTTSSYDFRSKSHCLIQMKNVLSCNNLKTSCSGKLTVLLYTLMETACLRASGI